MDPHVILGGFSTGPDFRCVENEHSDMSRLSVSDMSRLSVDIAAPRHCCALMYCFRACHRRNYSADATAFVITYPIDSDPAKRGAALAWEAAFIELANHELRDMAHAANLTFAFQAER